MSVTVRARPERFLCALACLIGSAGCCEAATTWRFDIAAGPLFAGISRIGTISGTSIVAPDAVLLAGQGPAIHMTGDAGQALKQLLRFSHAKAIRLGQGAWRIVPDEPRVAARAPQGTVETTTIIVSGAKRRMPLASYPAGLSLVDGARLDRMGSTPDIAALSRMEPALQSTHLGPGRDKLFLRGIADSSFNGSSVALVGQYLNDLRLSYNSPDPDLRLFDVDRVEILEGPQGTLYGAGSMAGLIRIVPKVPQLARSEGALWGGATGLAHGAPGADAGAIVNIPLVPGQVAVRLLGYTARDGGYIDDARRGADDVNRTHTSGGRGALRVVLGTGWTLDLGGIIQTIRNRDAQYAERDLGRLTRASSAAQPSFNLFRSAAITLTGSLRGVDLTSTTGLVRQSLGQTFLPDDGDADTVYQQFDRSRLLSQEVRLSSRLADSLEWVAGASGLWSRSREDRSNSVNDLDRSLGTARNGVRDATLFGEMTVRLVEGLSLTVGGRLSWVRLEGEAIGAQSKGAPLSIGAGHVPTFKAIRHERFAAPTLALGWNFAPGHLLYLRYSEGYRPGGQTASGIIERFDADRLYAMEIGYRLTPNGAPLSAQISATVGRWTNLQADTLDYDGLPVTHNVGDTRIRSLSASLHWHVLQDLELTAAATIAGGHVTSADDETGGSIRSAIPDIARDAASVGLEYCRASGARALGLKVRANHVGHSVLGSGPVLAGIGQGGYWLLSGGGELRRGPVTWSLFVDNLLDSAANSFAFGIPSFRLDDRFTTPLRPRSVRVGVRRDF